MDRMHSLLAWQSRDGHIQVLAGCLMGTHIHLILESLDGRLDVAMQRIEDTYARHYNRTRKHNGHVFKGRYFSREIFDPIDLVITVDYIDWNPVSAQMCARPEEYPHGTARHYMGVAGLPWLAKDRLEALACRLAGAQRYAPEFYPLIWQHAERAGARPLVARAEGRPSVRIASIVRLATLGPLYVQEWLRKQMRSEEGRDTPCLLLPLGVVVAGVRALDLPHGEALTMQAGLLRTVAGLSTVEVGQALGISQAAASRRAVAHRERMEQDAPYSMRVAGVVAGLVAERYGELARRLGE